MTSFGVVPLTTVEEYFGSLNATSRRIIQDISAVRQSYDSVWDEIGDKEKEQILDENIIPPEVSLQYESSGPNVTSIFPRYKVHTGQKKVTVDVEVENGANDLESKTYTYLDEHSAPFHWKTQSQQELRFESGRPVSIASSEAAEKGLEKLISSSPSKILHNRQSLIRYSKGNPCFAKPVGIPIVPNDKSKSNNLVLENEDNRIAFDFERETPSLRTSSSSPDSVKSSQGLLSKVKETKVSIRKSFTPSSNRKTTDQIPSPSSTLSSISSVVSSSPLKIVKPNVAPPPPPPQNRPTSAPPPPPSVQTANVEASQDQLVTSPLEESFKDFKINLSTDSIEIPKTGFDFLDNW